MLHLNRELINDVMDTPVILYKLNPTKTQVNSYGESDKKKYEIGVQIACMLRVENQQATEEMEMVNIAQTIEAAFLREELRLTNLLPTMGDIIEFDNHYYEINTAIDAQYWAGRTAYNHAIVCQAHLTRKSNLQLERPNR
jgi:hypothetical protein